MKSSRNSNNSKENMSKDKAKQTQRWHRRMQLKMNTHTPVLKHLPITMRMIKLAKTTITTTKVATIRTLTTDMITIKVLTQLKMEPSTTDTMTKMETGLTPVDNNTIRVSTKDIGMRTTNGLTRVAKITTTTIRLMTQSLIAT